MTQSNTSTDQMAWLANFKLNHDDVDIKTLVWPSEQAALAITSLAQASNFASESPATMAQADSVTATLTAQADQLGLFAQPVTLTYAELPVFLRRAAPALLPMGDGYLLLVQGGQTVRLLGPDMQRYRLSATRVIDAYNQLHLDGWQDSLNDFVQAVSVAPHQSNHLRRTLLGRHLAAQPLPQAWLLRISHQTSFRQMARQARLLPVLLIAALLGVVAYSLQVVALALFTQVATQPIGNDAQVVIAAFIWLASMPFYGASLRYAFELGPLFSIQLEQRLFQNALYGDGQAIQQQGAGQLMGWVLQAKEFEDSLVSGGLQGFRLLIALTPILSLLIISGPPLLVVSLSLWTLLAIGIIGVLIWRYIIIKSRYIALLTSTLEWMQGHLTRLIQEKRWLQSEDQKLSQYAQVWQQFDRQRVALLGIIGGGWFIAGLIAIADTYRYATPETTATLAIGITAILWAFVQIEAVPNQIEQIIRVVGSWALLRPLMRGQTTSPTPETTLPPATQQDKQYAMLKAENISFQHEQRQQPILHNTTLTVYAGDKIWLTGAPGAGKSTLAGLLAGWYTPQSGKLVLHGVTRQRLRDNQWRQAITGVLSFHDNHILSGTLAFNLLMGRAWPPAQDDIADAEAICRELGLGYLLDHMPHGLHQVVGERGWQLSHGERTRVFIARALLQRTRIIILDESLSALDPQTRTQVMETIERRAQTLIVIESDIEPEREEQLESES